MSFPRPSITNEHAKNFCKFLLEQVEDKWSSIDTCTLDGIARGDDDEECNELRTIIREALYKTYHLKA